MKTHKIIIEVTLDDSQEMDLNVIIPQGVFNSSDLQNIFLTVLQGLMNEDTEDFIND